MDEEQLQQIAAQLRQPHGEDGLKTAEWMNKGNVNMHHHTLAILNAKAGDNILEIGMGNGFHIKNILSIHPNIKYTGCDFSELMVEESKKRNASWMANGSANFVFSDAASLPFANNSFNKIFTINTIYFWEDKITVLNEINRVLQPEGELIIAFRPKHFTEKYPFIKYEFNQFSLDDVVKLLSENGFIIVNKIENPEPDVEMNGEIMKMENVIVIGKKE